MNKNRTYWVSILERLAVPVLEAGAAGRLRRDMPVRGGVNRENVAHLEAVGRLLSGIAPWLNCPGLTGEEAALQERLRRLARETLKSISDPASPDFLFDGRPGQFLVDAAYVAQTLLRAREALWEPLSDETKNHLLDGFEKGRKTNAMWSNWLCFSAMCESTLWVFGREPDMHRIDICLRAHEKFYKGDGVYGDGENFHWDYYNSFVIHPMLLDILDAVEPLGGVPRVAWDKTGFVKRDEQIRRSQRYALVQERMIAPDGSFPPLGRSLAYRMGAFQTLAAIALQHRLPDELPPAQARCALTAVIHRLMDAPGTWDEKGWLQVGLCGHQPSLGEVYVCTGSLYICSNGLLPLGLPPDDPFWACPDLPWTSVKVFGGQDIPADHAW
jgi:hypothetical protein